jgi:hypothetical protein
VIRIDSAYTNKINQNKTIMVKTEKYYEQKYAWSSCLIKWNFIVYSLIKMNQQDTVLRGQGMY